MGWWMDIMRKALGHLSEDELIGAALDGLDGPERERAEAHLRACAMCRRALRDWLDVHSSLAGLARITVPDQGLADRVLHEFRRQLTEHP